MAILERRRFASGSELRWFGLIVLAFSMVVAGLVAWKAESTRVASVVVSLGGLLCVLYYAVPSLRLPIYRAWMLAFHPVGWLVSHAILLGIWYLVMTPVGLVLRVVGYDPLERRIDRSRSSYWVERPINRSLDQYFQQF